jgi:hypothetical protein
MTALLGTLPFLATLWLLVVLGAKVLEESGAKIAAALKGAPVQRPFAAVPPARLRTRIPAYEIRCERPSLRAAA